MSSSIIERGILSRFSPDFEEKARINPEYNAVYHMILSGVDEYKIIEDLLRILHERNNEIIKLAERVPKDRYIIKKPNDE